MAPHREDSIVGDGARAGRPRSGVPSRSVRCQAPFVLLPFMLVGCEGQTTAGGDQFQLEISTVGVDLDPDGYELEWVLNGGTPESYEIDPNDSAVVDFVIDGAWTVTISGIAPNCSTPSSTMSGSGSQSVSVVVTCVGAGTVRVMNVTTGDDPDADGFTATLAGESQPLAPNGEVTFTEVTTGDVNVALGDIAASCSVSGSNPRPVTVTSAPTTDVAFTLTCATLVASVVVTPYTDGVAVGATTTYTARTFAAGGAELFGLDVAWSVGDAGVATVDPATGVVTGVAEGSTTVIATATRDGVSGEAEVVVVGSAGPLNKWINPDGGSWDFFPATNWSKGVAPLPGDSAVIDIATVNPVSGLVYDARVAYLTVGADFETAWFRQGGGTLTIDNAAVFGSGALYALEGGTLAGTGDLLVDGTLAWTGGTMTGPGSTVIGNTPEVLATLEAYGDLVLDGRDLTINGYAVFHGGTIDVRNGATITIGLSRIVDFFGDLMTIQGEVVNDGQLTVHSGSVLNVETLVNNGTIIVQSGGVLDVDSLTDNGTIIYE